MTSNLHVDGITRKLHVQHGNARAGKLEHLSIAGHVLQVVKISYLLRFIAYARNRWIFLTTTDSDKFRCMRSWRSTP